MWQLKTSALFDRQVIEYAYHYKGSANIQTAEAFLDAVKDALEFIQQSPRRCPVFKPHKNIKELQSLEYRKWSLKQFPFTCFFRLEKDLIKIEVLYHQRMDIAQRLLSDSNED